MLLFLYEVINCSRTRKTTILLLVAFGLKFGDVATIYNQMQEISNPKVCYI